MRRGLKASCLEYQLRQHGYALQIGKTIFLIRDTFQNAHGKIVAESQQRYSRGGSRVIFFLDQCGYSDVPAALFWFSGNDLFGIKV
jgi:hypothetical protein